LIVPLTAAALELALDAAGDDAAGEDDVADEVDDELDEEHAADCRDNGTPGYRSLLAASELH
jgi:hypothetical protein